eukprot:m.249126 g.249126  ORF g.249126 m.249126 type:complete len:79 (-) comp19514_c1_seq1:170-406(-)
MNHYERGSCDTECAVWGICNPKLCASKCACTLEAKFSAQSSREPIPAAQDIRVNISTRGFFTTHAYQLDQKNMVNAYK